MRIFWALLVLLFGCAVVACAAIVHDAQVIEPDLQGGCKTAEDNMPGNLTLDLVCFTLEEADKLVASYPAGVASKVSSNTIIAADGGVVATQYRVRLHVAVGGAGVSDAGRD